MKKKLFALVLALVLTVSSVVTAYGTYVIDVTYCEKANGECAIGHLDGNLQDFTLKIKSNYGGNDYTTYGLIFGMNGLPAVEDHPKKKTVVGGNVTIKQSTPDRKNFKYCYTKGDIRYRGKAVYTLRTYYVGYTRVPYCELYARIY